MRLEILDTDDKILAVHRLEPGLTLLGKSPGANVHLSGEGVGPLHVALKLDNPGKLTIMDLGGPTPLLVDGKERLALSADDGPVIVSSLTVTIVGTT